MADRKPFLERVKEGVVLFDGGFGTELYNRGIFLNKCFESLNLSNQNLVRQIHEDYKAAGADVLETNTFGANRFKLKPHQLDDKVYEINNNGAKVAREAAGDELYVAGSIGPLSIKIEPLGPTSVDEAKDYYKEQIRPLVDGGVDLLIFETFIYPEELKAAIEAAREVCDLPVTAQITIEESGASLTGAKPEVIIEELESFGADIIGANCTVGPRRMLNWLEMVRGMTDMPISLMPNAGKPKNFEGRNIYLTNPEYIGEYAKHYIQGGANVIGGCCGTGPDHIRRMRNMVNAVKPELIRSESRSVSFKKPDDVEPVETPKRSRLARQMHEGHFVKFVELLAPHGVNPEKQIDKAREMYQYGIDIINIPDGPRASARMSALLMAVLIQREVGIETLLHYVTRDRNVIGMQSDLLGAYAMGLKNILGLTGDPPKIGNYPDATAVFDVDSIGLINIINRLNHGLDIAGNPIGEPTGFFIGCGANPGAINMDEELRRINWKVEAGAQFIVTQPVFDVDILANFLKKIEHLNVPLIAGLWPLTSIRNAEFMNNEIPECHVPDPILKRLRAVSDSKEKSREEGIQVARESLAEMMKMDIRGVQIAAPFGRVQSVIKVLDGFTFY